VLNPGGRGDPVHRVVGVPVVAVVAVLVVPGHLQAVLGLGKGKPGGVTFQAPLAVVVADVDQLGLALVLVGGGDITLRGVDGLVLPGLELQAVLLDPHLQRAGKPLGVLGDVALLDGLALTDLQGFRIRLEAGHIGPVVGGYLLGDGRTGKSQHSEDGDDCHGLGSHGYSFSRTGTECSG